MHSTTLFICKNIDYNKPCSILWPSGSIIIGNSNMVRSTVERSLCSEMFSSCLKTSSLMSGKVVRSHGLRTISNSSKYRMDLEIREAIHDKNVGWGHIFRKISFRYILNTTSLCLKILITCCMGSNKNYIYTTGFLGNMLSVSHI